MDEGVRAVRTACIPLTIHPRIHFSQLPEKIASEYCQKIVSQCGRKPFLPAADPVSKRRHFGSTRRRASDQSLC